MSESIKSRPAASVIGWIAAQAPIRLASISLYELSAGVEQTPAGRRRRLLEEWLGRLLASGVEVIAFDRHAALEAARLGAEARRRGRSLPERDLLILATARASGFGVATRSVDHFRGYGVSVYDPFGDVHAV